jgi:pimeloyl-ACP methyl ester carboxylesterase
MLPLTDTLPSHENARKHPTLVLLHSFGLSRREWSEVATLLADEYRTVAIDTPGFGEARSVPGYSVAEMVEQFASTLRELNLDGYVLVGHSMTGKVAAILASRVATQFGLRGPAKLILLTPTPLGEEPISEETRQQLLQETRNQENGETFVASHSSLPLPPEIRARAVEDYLRANQQAWNAWLAKGTHEDWVSRAAPIETETLVIAAENDHEWGAQTQQRLTMPHLNRARQITVEGSGHLVPMEAPDKLAALLREFASR